MIEVLAGLGLTQNQSKIFLALMQYGAGQARDLARIAGISRQEVYRIMPKLEKRGLVERRLAFPTEYNATPIEQGLQILNKEMIYKQNALRDKTIGLIQHFKNNTPRAHLFPKDEYQFQIVPGKEAFIRRLKNHVSKLKTSMDAITTARRFSVAIPECFQEYREALNRGVRFRIATEKKYIDKKTLEIVRSFTKYPIFEVRYLHERPEAVVVIYDKLEAFVTTSVAASFRESPSLWSDNNCFVILAQSYFDNQWKKTEYVTSNRSSTFDLNCT